MCSVMVTVVCAAGTRAPAPVLHAWLKQGSTWRAFCADSPFPRGEEEESLSHDLPFTSGDPCFAACSHSKGQGDIISGSPRRSWEKSLSQVKAVNLEAQK